MLAYTNRDDLAEMKQSNGIAIARIRRHLQF